MLNKLNFRQRRFFKYGLPFLVLVAGGSVGLREFTQVKFQYYSKPSISPDELEKQGIHMKKFGEVTLETEFEKVQKLNIDDWQQVRGPRPWEDKAN